MMRHQWASGILRSHLSAPRVPVHQVVILAGKADLKGVPEYFRQGSRAQKVPSGNMGQVTFKALLAQ